MQDGRAANFPCKIYKVWSHGKHIQIRFYGEGESDGEKGEMRGREDEMKACIGVRRSFGWIGSGWPASLSLVLYH